MVFSENVLVIQEQQHEEFLTLQLPLSTGKLGGHFARNSTILTYTWISDLAFQWHFCVIFEQLNPKLQRNRLMCATFSVHSRKYSQSLNDNLTSFNTECGKIPENIGRLSDVLKNTFLNVKNAPEMCHEMFSGPKSSRDF